MDSKEINKVIDNISKKMDITGERIIDAYRGEAKIYVIVYWIYLIFSIVGMFVSYYIIMAGFGMKEIVKDYWGVTRFTDEGIVMLIFGGVLMTFSFITLIVQLSSIQTYLEAKKLPDTYAITRIIDILTD